MAAQYPTAAGTDANLWVAVNNKSTTLSDNPLTIGATTVNAASTTGFPTSGYITIDAEAIKYTGTTGTSFTTCTRGADGTAASSHLLNAQVTQTVVADHHNVLKDEIKAVEGDLVAAMAAITPVTPASTAGSMLTRLAHIVSAINTMTGVTWPTVRALLPLAGGTMTGAIAMGTGKITGLGNGTAATDAAAFGQVKYLQAVQNTTATLTSTTSSTFVSGGLQVNITPSSASNRVRITLSGNLYNSNPLNTTAELTVMRNTTTNLASTHGFAAVSAPAAAANVSPNVPVSVVFIDSPASASSTAYNIYIRSTDNTTSVSFGNPPGVTCVLIAEEIV
jgi:hypothetical protein